MNAEVDGDVFEHILDDLGEFSHWQRVIYCMVGLAELLGAFHIMSPVIIGAVPNWYCVEYENATIATDVITTTTSAATTSILASNGLAGNFTDFQACENSAGQACTDIVFRDDFTSFVSQWSLVCGKNFVSDLITSIQMAGLLAGAFLFSQLSDLIGRKKCFYLAFFVEAFVGLISSFSTSWQMFAVCRFLVGAGFGGNQVIQVIYPMEFVGRRWRVTCGTIGFWSIGTLILSLLGYLLRDWRTLTQVCCAIQALYFLTWIIVPESPRWLIQHGRVEEAKEILANIARHNKRPCPDLEGLQYLHDPDKDDTKYTLVDLLREWRYLKVALIKFVSWFTVFVIYYMGSYNLKNFAGDRYVNMVLGGIVDWISMVSVMAALTLLGRKKGLLMYLVVALVSLAGVCAIGLSGGGDKFAELVLALTLLARGAGIGGSISNQIYSAELFPTVIRNIGVGFGSIAARLGGILAPQLVYLGTINLIAPYVICAVLCVIIIPLLMLLPETRGRPLQDKYIGKSDGKEMTHAANGQVTA